MPSPANGSAGNAGRAEPPKSGFPVVGIGASAGGLAAFEAFFSAMPPDTDPGVALVLVQHLAPDHKSILTDLIKRYTRMKAFEVTDGMTVRPNCAYIIPPNRDMAFLDGALHLLEPISPRGLRLPIDYFFRSLAQDQRERAICIVLSGTGSDGTLGLRAVKGEGGMAMVQSPESAAYDGMPRSAIATGLVDYVLPPAEMPSRLLAYIGHAFGGAHRPALPPPIVSENALKKIFVLLRSQTGHDFSQYKMNTIARRVERRMAVHQIETMSDYVKYLQHTPGEAEALFRDLLIGVTSFFRDPAAFDALEEQVIPRLFKGKAASAPVRVWVPGCSTGEEAYSIAILLQAQMEAIKRSFKVQVFATDIDGRAIETARSGIFPGSIAHDVSPDRLERFFSRQPDASAYRIRKNIRDLMVFSDQDMIKDPPFSKLDLISCRNLLIYLDGDLQKRIMNLFHYALNPGGFLFLGTSETVGEGGDLFTTLDRKMKIFQRRETPQGAARLAFGRQMPAAAEEKLPPRGPEKAPDPGRPPLREVAEQALLQQFAPVGALVDGRGDILYLHGRTGAYLEPAPGEATTANILKMAREGLRQELTTALHKAVVNKARVQLRDLRIGSDKSLPLVRVTVQPMADESEAARFLVVFEPLAEREPVLPPDAAPGKAPASGRKPTAAEAQRAALLRELRAKDEYLQSANEELETFNEELKSANEEMQSINEELQSTNEELETSKEELQSVNEELATVNTELQAKVTDLSRATNDMANLLSGTGIGTVFVDHQLRILRFTPAVTPIINLIPGDVGRPVGHIVSNLVGYDRLTADAKAVLDSLIPKEIEVRTQAGAWYLMRLQPYRTQDNVIEGAVITFVDITERRIAQDALQEVEGLRRLAAVVHDARDAVILQDVHGRIMAWNPAAERIYGWTEAEALALNIRDLVPEDRRDTEPSILPKIGKGGAIKPYRTVRRTKSGGAVEIWLTATALENEAGIVYAVSTTERLIDSADRE